MLQAGADIRWLDFKQVVSWPNPDVLWLFIERGADTQSGYPIAEVLKHAPRAFLGVYKEFLDRYFLNNSQHAPDTGGSPTNAAFLWQI
jgi:hypothetical protein